MDVRILNEDNDSNDQPIAAQVRRLARANAQVVVQVNASGDIVNPGGAGGSGGDGAILDGADSGIKATVKDYANAKPLTVVLVNASGDAYNGNSSTVTVNKWNLVPTQDAVHVNSGVLGVTGDVSTKPLAGQTWPVSIAGTVNVSGSSSANPVGVSGDVSTVPKAGQTWPISFAGIVGVQVIGGSVGARVSVSGDQLNVIQSGAWATAVTGDVSTTPKAGSTWPISLAGPVGVQVLGGSIGARVSVSGDQLAVTQQGTWSTAVTGDVSTTPKTGSTWPTQNQGTIGVNVIGGSVGGTVSVSGDTGVVSRPGSYADPRGPIGVQVVGYSGTTASQSVTGDVSVNPATTIPGSFHPVSGDTGIRDGADPTIKGTVRDYSNSNPLAVALTNASGDTFSPAPKEPICVTRSGRITASGTTTVAGAYNGRVIKVSRYEFQCKSASDTMASFGSGASGEQLTSRWSFGSREGIAEAVSQVGGGYVFKTQLNQALVIEHFDANDLQYSVTFHTGDSF